MKRALTITMTLALFGSLLFMGFAGSAAASHSHDKDDGDNTAIVDQQSTAETNQYQSVHQSNNLKQGDNYASAYFGNANAGNFAEQSNANAQTAFTTSTNSASVSQW